MVTIYPAAIDTDFTLKPIVDGKPVSGASVDQLRKAIMAIEEELGVKPSGTYGTVRDRLDSIENNISSLQPVTIGGDLGGTLHSPLVIGFYGRPISSDQPVLGQALLWDGVAWVPSDIGDGSGSILNGDVTGQALNNTVVKLRGQEVASQSLSLTQDGYVLTWDNTDGYWLAKPSASQLAGDVTGSVSANTVNKIRGNLVANQTLGVGQDGFGLVWDNTDGYWAAKPLVVTESVGGDLGDFLPNPTVRGIWNAAVPQVLPSNPSATTGFVVGNVLQVTNTIANNQALGYGALNLGNGTTSTNTSGTLPVVRQAPQNLTGDLSGFTNSSGSSFNFNAYGAIVTKLQTIPVQFASLGSTQDGYVLTYDNSSTQWKALPNTSGASLSGDITGAPGSTFVSKIQGKTVSASSPSVNNVLTWNGTNWVPVDHSILGNVTGTLGGSTVVAIQNNAILAQALSIVQDGYVLTWNNATSQWQAKITAGGSLPGGAAGGDLSGFYPAPSVIAVNGTSVPSSPSVNQVLVATGATSATWTKISDSQIVTGGINNVSISNTAAIAGSKITPNFGGQAISGVTTIVASSSIRGTSFVVDNGSTLPTVTSGTGVPSSTPPTGSIYLRTDGATTGTESIYSYEGAVWVPIGSAAAGSAGGDLSGNYPNPTVVAIQKNPVNNQLLGSTQDGYVLTWVNSSNNWIAKPSGSTTGSAGGDLSGTYPNPTVAKINGSSVPAGGSLTTGNVLQVNGTSSLTYGALNLGGGANFVTGTLPTGNQAAQSLTLTGDVTSSGGTTTSATTSVVKIRGNAVKSQSLGAGQDGYVLTWVNASNDWEAQPTSSGSPGITQLTGDVTAGPGSGSQPAVVVAIQGNAVSASAALAGQFLVENASATGSAWTTVSGDITPSTSPVGKLAVTKINGASVPASGALTTGNVLQVTGANALSYSAVNLGGGANFVTGTLPSGNQASQTMGGDVSGTTSSATVIKIQHNAVQATTLGASQDGYILTWINANNEWEASPAATGTFAAGGDLSGSSTSQNVIKIQGNAVKSGALSSIDDGYILTWINGNNEWEAKPAPSGSFSAGGDLTGTSSSQTVHAIQGVVITGSASGGQVLTATSPTAANWQTPSGGGSATYSYRTITSDYTVDSGGSDYYIFCNHSAIVHIILPVPNGGRTIVIKDVTGNAFTNNIVIVQHSTEQIEGVASSYTITENLSAVSFASDGTNWWIA